MELERSFNSCSLIIIIIASFIFYLNFLEFTKLFDSWSNKTSRNCSYNDQLFNLIVNFLSCLASLFCLFISVCLAYNNKIAKIIKDVLFSYMIFIYGYLLLCLCVYSIFNWKTYLYNCTEHSTLQSYDNMTNKILMTRVFTNEINYSDNRNFSFRCLLTILICGSISLTVTLLNIILSCLKTFFNSYRMNEEGSIIYNKIFWKLLFSEKSATQILKDSI